MSAVEKIEIRYSHTASGTCTHRTYRCESGRTPSRPRHEVPQPRFRVHRRIDGGKSAPGVRFFARLDIAVFAWTAREAGFDRRFCALKSPFRPRGAVHAIASKRRSRSVQPSIAAAFVLGWRSGRARGMKPRNLRRQVHCGLDLLGDGLLVDERDEAELSVAIRADDLKVECFSQQLCPSPNNSSRMPRAPA